MGKVDGVDVSVAGRLAKLTGEKLGRWIGPPGGGPGPGVEGGRSFLDALRARVETGGGGDASSMRDPRSAREAAEAFVSSSLVEPVFKQMREGEGAAEPFAPGEAEKAFRPLLDAELSARLVRSQEWGLVDRVARDLERGGAA